MAHKVRIPKRRVTIDGLRVGDTITVTYRGYPPPVLTSEWWDYMGRDKIYGWNFRCQCGAMANELPHWYYHGKWRPHNPVPVADSNPSL